MYVGAYMGPGIQEVPDMGPGIQEVLKQSWKSEQMSE